MAISLSGRALPRHGRGHRFESGIANVNKTMFTKTANGHEMQLYPAFEEGNVGRIKDIVFRCVTCDDLQFWELEKPGKWDVPNELAMAYAEEHMKTPVNGD